MADETNARPIAFIYDRHASPNRDALTARIEAAQAYARRRGWVLGGLFVDIGDDALSATERPAFDRLCNYLHNNRAVGVEMVCLVREWDRLSRYPEGRTRLRNRVTMAGGWTATADGQDDREPLQPSTMAALFKVSL
jgi:DNA invertase Pin-like site-specific DNA recombinase